MLLAGTDEHDLTKLDEYRAIGGYAQVPKARAMTPDALIDELLAANLRGRGGAGFPMGRKASLIDRKSAKPKYLVVNADESEPGAFKDRQVMAEVPHRLIEGCLIAAHAIESTDVFIYIRGEYLDRVRDPPGRVDEARAAGALRRRRGHGLPRRRRLHLRRGDGAARLARRPARPAAAAPAVPAGQGLYNAPTQINNVCTIATVPTILELGAAEFAKTGAECSPGTAIFSISGNVVRPGNYELELGTPMRELIYDLPAGSPTGAS